jgi:hypothetical protein
MHSLTKVENATVALNLAIGPAQHL